MARRELESSEGQPSAPDAPRRVALILLLPASFSFILPRPYPSSPIVPPIIFLRPPRPLHRGSSSSSPPSHTPAP
eukprot:5173122-Pyramimonas_sp.AAC.1